jgi:hypothetical protein
MWKRKLLPILTLYAFAGILIGGAALTNALLYPRTTAFTQPYVIELNLQPEAVGFVDPMQQAYGLISKHTWSVTPTGLIGLFLAMVGAWFTLSLINEIWLDRKRCAN